MRVIKKIPRSRRKFLWKERRRLLEKKSSLHMWEDSWRDKALILEHEINMLDHILAGKINDIYTRIKNLYA